MSRRPLRICVVTGTRAEFGLLQPVIDALRTDPAFDVEIVVTGTHLSPEFGMTVREIEEAGLPVGERVEMLLSSDSGVGCAKSLGLAAIGLADAYARLAPAIVLLLGDRYEVLAAAATALVMGIPVAHLSGGDVTAGAFDDAIRHSITKMAHLHFVASEDAARRVRQLGEPPERVHTVGDPGLDVLRTTPLLDQAALEHKLGIRFRERNLLVTFHPATADVTPSAEQYAELLAALDSFGPEVGLVFTQSNADPEGRKLTRMTESFVAGRDGAWTFPSLGRIGYLSAMAVADAVVGNSSSGLVEAPSLATPTVNIGERQAGRLRAASVIDCPAERGAIVEAIEYAFTMDCSTVENPYGDGHAAERILAILKEIEEPRTLLLKRFHDLDTATGKQP